MNVIIFSLSGKYNAKWITDWDIESAHDKTNETLFVSIDLLEFINCISI